MFLHLSDEQEMIKSMARDFAKNELEPFAYHRDQGKTLPMDVLVKMGELGLMGMMVPSVYGGVEAGAVGYCLALQEIAYACPSTAWTISTSNISMDPLLRYGNDEQKQKYLGRLAHGQAFGALAVTEYQAGSDLGSIETRAEKMGTDYIVNGVKSFVTNGSFADIIILIARTGKEKSKRGLSAFILEKRFPGITIGPKCDYMGMNASDTVEIIFKDCIIPEENLIGREGDGFKIALMALDIGRLGIAALSVGIAKACLDEAVSYSKTRKQFGKFISEFQAIQWMLADTATEIEAATMLYLKAAALKDKGLPFTKEASMAKLFASETANKAAHRALQVHGGYGYIKEYKVERLYRDARLMTIHEGTSEIQRIIISKEILKG